MVVGAVGALLLYWLRSNDWMALFTAMVLANSGIAASGIYTSSNPVIIIFNRSILFPTFFWILVFPNGKLLPRWSWAYLLLLLPSFVLQSVIDLELLSWARLGDLTYMAMLLTYMAMLALFTILYFRYSDTFSAIERQQTKWVITPLIAGFIVIGFTYSFSYSFSISGLQYEELAIAQFFYFLARIVVFVSLAVGIFISILRYRLWDIDIIINRALVYGTLTAIVIGIYVLIVGGLGTAIQGRNNLLVSILATGLVAVLVQPLRDRLQRGVNRMMYGERDDPVTVLSRLGQRLEGTLAPDAVLPSLVETVAQTLKLPYVAIEMTTEEGPDSTSAISHGQLQPDLVRLPLIYQTETIGQLVVSPRAQGEALNPMDRHLLENIAHQAGMAVHAVSLTTDLQRSRQRLVTTREEERRRLRRDLHDGLGPNLASQGLKLASVKQLLEHDPMSAIPLLEQVMAQNQSTVEEVRQLVYGLRPPALDELGLVAAIRD
jgi:signal transduction histidine kinase